MGGDANEAHNVWMIVLLENSTFLQELPLDVVTQRFATRFNSDLLTSHFECTTKHFTKLTLKATQCKFNVILHVQVPSGAVQQKNRT
jgi:hypothetical protein